MYTHKKSDIDDLLNNFDEIKQKARIKNRQNIEPTRKESDAISKIIIDFVKRKKRKIYGGFAIDVIFKDKNPKNALYDEWEIDDVDFYSPEPLKDLHELANLLHEAGFKNVQAGEAQHEGTYKIFVNLQDYIDISYVSANMYHRMPFVTIDGFTLTHPLFMMIDYYRMFTDPMISYHFKFEKRVPRYFKLQEFYPISKAGGKLKYLPIIPEKHKNEINGVLDTVLNFTADKETVIVFGWYAFNYYLKKSELKYNDIQKVDVPYYEFISTDYKKDAVALYELIKKTHPELSDKITTIEYYPFHNYLGYGVSININNIPVVYIYDYDERCTPYKKISYNSKTIQLSTFNFTFMMYLIMVMRSRAWRSKELETLNRMAIYQLLLMKQHFYKVHKDKKITDDTPFQEFVVNCTGDMKDLFRHKWERVKSRIDTKKQYPYSYKPGVQAKKTDSSYIFPNSSGNEIRKNRNLKVFKIELGKE